MKKKKIKYDIALELGKRGKKVLVLNIRGLLFQLLDVLKISQIYESMQNCMGYKLMKKYFDIRFVTNTSDRNTEV